jgi:cephalosporin hydroxylase
MVFHELGRGKSPRHHMLDLLGESPAHNESAAPQAHSNRYSRSMSGAFSHAAGYPAAYAAALVARRRLRRLGHMSNEQALEFARSFRWRGGWMRPTQADEEILWLLELVEAERPQTVLEIGTDEGGTLFLWSRVAAPDASLVAVDTRPLGLLGHLSPYALVRRGFARERQTVNLLLPADSHDPATLAEVRRLLDDRQLDFLFIDGDHSYEGVKEDFRLYEPLVRPAGLIAIHDIASEFAPGVARFWSELTQTRATDERVSSQYGMGVVRVG